VVNARDYEIMTNRPVQLGGGWEETDEETEFVH